MDKKKIIIVSASFYPQNSPRANRATELAKELVRQGHQVKVLTVFGDSDYTKLAAEFKITLVNLGKRNWESLNFGKSKIGYFLTRVIYRLLSLGLEYPDIELALKVKRALINENNHDLLISSAVPYPVHWGVAAARKIDHRIAKIWVADCGDPYMGCQTDSFKKLFYFKYVEKWFMRKADFISIPIESARSGYYPEFQNKIRIIPQGFRFDPIKESGLPVKNEVPTFVYAGGFIPGIRDPRLFLDLLCSLDENFKFIVYTNTKKLIQTYKAKLNDKLEIREYIPRHELLKFMAKADFLVNFDNNTGVQSPSKLIDYSIVKRPILNIMNFIDTQIIISFIHGDYQGQLVIKNIDQYKIENVSRQFLDLTQS